jgi:hypothetical protein
VLGDRDCGEEISHSHKDSLARELASKTLIRLGGIE